MKKKIILVLLILLSISFGSYFAFKDRYVLDNNKKIQDYDKPFDFPNLGDAAILFNSNVVNFSNNALKSRNVQNAVDELYSSIQNGCKTGYNKGNQTGGTYTCTKASTNSAGTTSFESSDVKYDNTSSGLSSTNVSSAIVELAELVPSCLNGYVKQTEVNNSYNCKKAITITANNQTITYGNSISQNTNQVTVEGLETGHSLNSITLTGSTANVPGGTITPSNAVIYDSGSNNITSTYTINYETGTLTINRKATTMSISPTSGSITPGASTTTTITTDGDGTKSCTTSNSSIATCSVSGNIVTINGVAAGSATITVKQAQGTNYNAATDKTYSLTVSYPLAATYISSLTGLETNAAGNKIYSGTDPDNYVWFNNEQWRIIGVYGNNLKIIKATPSTTSQAYINSSSYSNAWSGSTMQTTYLYNTYWGTLSATAQGMIEQNATWNVGTCGYDIAASAAYTCASSLTWQGKVGLIATYEYLYAAENDGTCWTTSGYFFNDGGCHQKDWLFSTVIDSGNYRSLAWTLNPCSDDSYYAALNVQHYGFVGHSTVGSAVGASPVVFLKSTITITGGNGKVGETNSYKLG